jgi:hypothetical protein
LASSPLKLANQVDSEEVSVAEKTNRTFEKRDELHMVTDKAPSVKDLQKQALDAVWDGRSDTPVAFIIRAVSKTGKSAEDLEIFRRPINGLISDKESSLEIRRRYLNGQSSHVFAAIAFVGTSIWLVTASWTGEKTYQGPANVPHNEVRRWSEFELNELQSFGCYLELSRKTATRKAVLKDKAGDFLHFNLTAFPKRSIIPALPWNTFLGNETLEDSVIRYFWHLEDQRAPRAFLYNALCNSFTKSGQVFIADRASKIRDKATTSSADLSTPKTHNEPYVGSHLDLKPENIIICRLVANHRSLSFKIIHVGISHIKSASSGDGGSGKDDRSSQNPAGGSSVRLWRTS